MKYETHGILPLLPYLTAGCVFFEFLMSQSESYIDAPPKYFPVATFDCWGWPFVSRTEAPHIAALHLFLGFLVNLMLMVLATAATYLVMRSLTTRRAWSFSIVDLLTITAFVGISCSIYQNQGQILLTISNSGLPTTVSGYAAHSPVVFLGFVSVVLAVAATFSRLAVGTVSSSLRTK